MLSEAKSRFQSGLNEMKSRLPRIYRELLSGKRISKLIALILFSSPLAYAQVNLKINPDIIVKTKTGVSVKVTGDLIEQESGYFKGLISSGQRTNVNGFAGLSLNPGLDGIINRVTGESYSKGNGELPNFKRYYEINNTGGTDVITNVEMVCIISGEYDERNSITAPYHIYGYSTEWTGYGDGSSNPPVSAENVTISTGLSDWIISDNSGIVSVDETEPIPEKYELYQNYPNPFNPETIIKFALPEAGIVRLTVYSILGEKVTVLVNGIMNAGYHRVAFNAANLSSGIYIYKIEAKDFTEKKKMILVK